MLPVVNYFSNCLHNEILRAINSIKSSRTQRMINDHHWLRLLSANEARNHSIAAIIAAFAGKFIAGVVREKPSPMRSAFSGTIRFASRTMSTIIPIPNKSYL